MNNRQFGQPVLREQLDTLLVQGRVPHAVLFYGEPGYGILPAALSLATDLLCGSPVEGKACLQCASCHRAVGLIHPDLHFLFPLAGSKSLSTEYYETWRETITTNPWLNVFQWTQATEVEGKQLDIHKEDIMHTTSRFSLESYEGRNKVMIIWMAQYLAREGNRLLKMIEEPPAGTYFILITHQREQILQTIRSRCIQLHCPPIRDEVMMDLLMTQYHVSPSDAKRMTQQAGQDMNRATSLIQGAGVNFSDTMIAWFRGLVTRRVSDLATWSSQMGGLEKEEQKQFALYTLAFLRQLLSAAADADHGNKAQSDMIRYLQQTYAPDMWYAVMTDLQSAYEKITRNANTKLLWLALSLAVKNHLSASRLSTINA